MEWARLLSRERLGRETPSSKDVRSEFQRDHDRIVFSAAFRRLQDKTQVFPLAESDYVRTRLTHSLEVSCVGRSLGTLAGAAVLGQSTAAQATPQDFGAILAAACLAHDIGNPPFGHSGEEAIRSWFETEGRAYLADLDPAQQADFLKFEGNAQGFRVLARLQNAQNPGGLQLTHAVLGTFSKYPRASHVAELTDTKRVSEKKFGFFQADSALFQKVAEALDLKKKTEGAWARHPLAFLMEAADDICYRIVDLEDGVRLGRVAFRDAEPLLRKLAFQSTPELTAGSESRVSDQKSEIEYLRARAINTLIYATVDVFSKHAGELLNGEFEQELVGCTPFASNLKDIKDLSIREVYAARNVLHIEAAGFEVLGGLLERVVPALARGDSQRSASDKKLLQLIPEQFQFGKTRYEQLLAATDFVSGMTDSFAVTLYRRLRGIELPRGG